MQKQRKSNQNGGLCPSAGLLDKFKTKINKLITRTHCKAITLKQRAFDTSGEGHIDVAIKIIIGVVVGALVLAGLILLWNNVIMPRLNKEVTGMFG